MEAQPLVSSWWGWGRVPLTEVMTASGRAVPVDVVTG